MYKLIYIFSLLLCTSQLFGQNCVNLNFPTAIADSCESAPFLCGNYLDNYCGTNAGLTDDAFGQSSGFLRLAPCESDLILKVSVSNCVPGSSGLIFRLYPDSCNAPFALYSDTILQNTVDTLIINNLEPLENYLLAISGVQGSQCEFNIQILAGIGTALPGPANCSCTGGGVEGPLQICDRGIVTYNLAIPTCFLGFGVPIGGNGEFCPPAEACPASLDSFILVWHIPSVMHFVGDSTGLSVEIALDTTYNGLDTIRYDSVWVSWHLVSSQPIDPLNFCACSEVGCSGGVFSLHIQIHHELRSYSCILSCSQPSCEILGVTYTLPGTYGYELDPCVTIAISIYQDDPTPIILPVTICQGNSTFLKVLNIDPEYSYQWSTGSIGPSVSVTPVVTTTYFVTATHFSGACIFTSAVMVTVIPNDNEDLGQVGVITCLEPCVTFLNQNYCIAGTYSVQVSPCTTKTFIIGNDPSLFQNNLPPVTICEGECYDFFGQPVCTSTTVTHVENCTLYVQQVIVNPKIQTDLGLVGYVTCSQPCFTYDGVTFCDPGTYILPDGVCGTKKFEINFKKTEINNGVVGTIDCAHNCIVYDGVEYCQSGVYTFSDSCTQRSFTIAENLDKPLFSQPYFDCLPSNTHFTVGFEITGIPPFKIDGAAVTGASFLSTPQPNGQTFSFILEQGNGCQTVVSGEYNCAQFCVTNAGLLANETLHGCAGQSSIQAQTVNMPVLAPGDVVDYILKTDDGQTLVRNPMGLFSFDPDKMLLEAVYFIQRNVGPPDASGFPDWASACTDSSNNQPVVFHALPNVSVAGDSSLCEGGMLTLTAAGAETYLWNDGDTDAIKEIQTVDPSNSGLYTVVGSSEYGCTGADSVEVVVHPEQTEGCCRPQLPNAFTPNGDGANDAFAPILPDCNQLEFAEMRVYSRWGELVFKSLKKDDRWDGTTANGSPASSDTYVFTFRYRLIGDEERTQKGEVTLLR